MNPYRKLATVEPDEVRALRELMRAFARAGVAAEQTAIFGARASAKQDSTLFSKAPRILIFPSTVR